MTITTTQRITYVRSLTSAELIHTLRGRIGQRGLIAQEHGSDNVLDLLDRDERDIRLELGCRGIYASELELLLHLSDEEVAAHLAQRLTQQRQEAETQELDAFAEAEARPVPSPALDAPHTRQVELSPDVAAQIDAAVRREAERRFWYAAVVILVPAALIGIAQILWAVQ